jgi:hypothetical protein
MPTSGPLFSTSTELIPGEFLPLIYHLNISFELRDRDLIPIPHLASDIRHRLTERVALYIRRRKSKAFPKFGSISGSSAHSGSGLRFAAAESAENKVMETWHVGAGGAVMIQDHIAILKRKFEG